MLLHGLAVVLSVVGWLLAAVSALQLLWHHRPPERGVLEYAVKGVLFFDAANFTASGAGWHRRMLVGFGLFTSGFLIVAATLVLAAP